MSLCETVISALYKMSPKGRYNRDERRAAEANLGSSQAFHGGIPRRAINLLDALASTLISRESQEIVAVGSHLTKERLTLYVAANGQLAELSRVKTQLESVWRSLKNIRSSLPPSSRMSPEPRGGTEQLKQHEQLRYDIYGYHGPKLIKRLLKGTKMGLDDFFEEVSSGDSEFVRPRGTTMAQGGKAFIYEDEMDLFFALGSVYYAIVDYLRQKDRETLVQLVHVIIMADNEFKKTSKTLGNDVDIFTDPRDENFFSRCDLIVTDPEGPITLEPGEFRRFWQKTFSLEHSIQELLRLPYSRRLGHILDCNFEVVTVPSQHNLLKYNMKKDSEFRETFSSPNEYAEFLENHSRRSYRKEVETHCECTLLAYFLRHDIDAFRYIGVSKPSCLPCSWYFEAYNSVARIGKTFHTRRSHGKRYPGWTFARIGGDFDSRIEDYLLRKARIELLANLNDRLSHRGTDSTDASGASGTLLDGDLQETHFGDSNSSTLRSFFGGKRLIIPQ